MVVVFKGFQIMVLSQMLSVKWKLEHSSWSRDEPEQMLLKNGWPVWSFWLILSTETSVDLVSPFLTEALYADRSPSFRLNNLVFCEVQQHLSLGDCSSGHRPSVWCASGFTDACRKPPHCWFPSFMYEEVEPWMVQVSSHKLGLACGT